MSKRSRYYQSLMYAALMEAGRMEDMKRAMKDAAYRKVLLEEMGE